VIFSPKFGISEENSLARRKFSDGQKFGAGTIAHLPQWHWVLGQCIF